MHTSQSLSLFAYGRIYFAFRGQVSRQAGGDIHVNLNLNINISKHIRRALVTQRRERPWVLVSCCFFELYTSSG